MAKYVYQFMVAWPFHGKIHPWFVGRFWRIQLNWSLCDFPQTKRKWRATWKLKTFFTHWHFASVALNCNCNSGKRQISLSFPFSFLFSFLIDNVRGGCWRQLQFWKAAKRSPPAKDIGVSSGEVQKAEIIPDFPKLVTIGSVGGKLFVTRLVWAH